MHHSSFGLQYLPVNFTNISFPYYPGAGLTSMVASVLGAEVSATEQESCLAYLRRNIELNPEIEVSVETFGWAENIENSDRLFDFVCGCDVTYDPRMFLDLLKVIKSSLARPAGVGLICHDDHSCPMSKFAYRELTTKSVEVGLTLEEGNLINKFRATCELHIDN